MRWLRTIARGGLALVALAQAEVGIWGEISPRGFFDDFPGAGHHWVVSMGPFNEHLVRDYAAAELGLAVLLLAMAIRFDRQLVLIGGVAFLVATVPHFAYHLTTTDSLSTTDNIANLSSFAIEIAVVAMAMLVCRREPRAVAVGRLVGDPGPR